MSAVQKVGLYALLSLLLFALVFAFVPTGTTAAAKTGAELEDVQLTLYPTRDPEAIWRFRAERVTNDPLTSTTVLSGLSGGERLLRARDSSGQFTGTQVLDATLEAGKLTIDGQDTLLTDKMQLHLVKECADIALVGDTDRPVKIEQGVGFSAPRTTLDAPSMNVKVKDLQMDFQFNILASGVMDYVGDLDARETCRNGKRVPRE